MREGGELEKPKRTAFYFDKMREDDSEAHSKPLNLLKPDSQYYVCRSRRAQIRPYVAAVALPANRPEHAIRHMYYLYGWQRQEES